MSSLLCDSIHCSLGPDEKLPFLSFFSRALKDLQRIALTFSELMSAKGTVDPQSFLTGWAGSGEEGLEFGHQPLFQPPLPASPIALVDFMSSCKTDQGICIRMPRFLPAGLPKSLWDAILQFSAFIAISYIQDLLLP